MTVKTRWTDDRIEELKREYPVTGDVAGLAARYGVTTNALRHVAQRYGIARRDHSHRDTWTDDRVQFLIDNAATMTYPELAAHLGLTPTTVRLKAIRLGVQRPYGWTDDRVARLRAEVGEVGVREMAARLGISAPTVRAKVRELGLATPRPGPRHWTPERVAEFRALYPTTSNEELGARYGLSVKSVGEIASRFGVRRARPVAGDE